VSELDPGLFFQPKNPVLCVLLTRKVVTLWALGYRMVYV